MNPEMARSLEKLAEPPSAAGPRAPAGQAKQGGHWPRRIIFWVIVAVAAFFGWKYWTPIKTAVMARIQGQPPPARAGRGAGGPAAVTAASANRGTIRVYLEAQGTVTAFNTVTVHTRVDGEIMKVYFVEGQYVKKGDPLVEIDPRPYKAQLDQASGQLAKDQALLTNAQLDLQRYQDAFKNGGAVPQQQVATQQALVDQDKGAIESDQS